MFNKWGFLSYFPRKKMQNLIIVAENQCFWKTCAADLLNISIKIEDFAKHFYPKMIINERKSVFL